MKNNDSNKLTTRDIAISGFKINQFSNAEIAEKFSMTEEDVCDRVEIIKNTPEFQQLLMTKGGAPMEEKLNNAIKITAQFATYSNLAKSASLDCAARGLIEKWMNTPHADERNQIKGELDFIHLNSMLLTKRASMYTNINASLHSRKSESGKIVVIENENEENVCSDEDELKYFK